MNLLSSFSFFLVLKEFIKLRPIQTEHVDGNKESIHFKNWKCWVSVFAGSSIVSIQNLAFNLHSISMSDDQSLSTHLRIDTALTMVVEFAFIVPIYVFSSVCTISTLIPSGESYAAECLSIKERFSFMWRKLKRPFITSFCILVFSVAFFFVCSVLVYPLIVLYNTPTTFAIAIVFGIFSFGLYLYMCVPWALLALVISVVEEETSYGLEALGKARDLVKGMRLHGFVLNVSYVVFFMIADQGFNLAARTDKLLIGMRIYSVLFAILVYLATFILMVAYKRLYFDCKMIHGEDVGLHGIALDTKLSTKQKVTDISV